MEKIDNLRLILSSFTEQDPLGRSGPLAGSIDIPTPHHSLQLSGNQVENNIEKILQSCHLASMDFQVSNFIKLAQTVEGYIFGYDHFNTVSMFLFTRYLVEQHAFVRYVASRLIETQDENNTDLTGRAQSFFTLLTRTRFATNDSDLVKQLSANGISKKRLKPFHINDCIKYLGKAMPELHLDNTYDYLSDRTHHNGASQYLGSPGYFKDSTVSQIWGRTFIHSARPVTRYEYPLRDAKIDRDRTVDIMLEHTSSLYPFLLSGIPLDPCTEKERTQHWNGPKQLKTKKEPPTPRNKKVGRNEPCPCGSGKKYKHCCLRKVH